MVGEGKTQLQMPAWPHFQNLCFKHQDDIYLSHNSEGMPTGRLAAAAWETQGETQFPSHLCAHGASFHWGATEQEAEILQGKGFVQTKQRKEQRACWWSL